MRPTPTTARVFRRRTRSLAAPQRFFERREEARVVLREPHGHAQVLGHAVARDGPYDHAFGEHRRIDRLGGAHADGDEVAARWNVFEAQALEAWFQLYKTGKSEYFARMARAA